MLDARHGYRRGEWLPAGETERGGRGIVSSVSLLDSSFSLPLFIEYSDAARRLVVETSTMEIEDMHGRAELWVMLN